MKKTLAFSLILALILPVLLLPAAAAEPEVYEFEIVEAVAPYSNRLEIEGLGSSVYSFNYDIPAGYYKVKFIYDNVEYLTSSFYYDGFVDNNSLDYGLKTYFDLHSWYSQYFPTYSGYNFNLCFTNRNEYVGAQFTFCKGSTPVGSFTSLFDNSLISYFALVSCNPLADELFIFTESLIDGFSDFTGTTLSAIVLGGLGVCAAPVLVWFGYRFIKGKAVKAFKKGKV